MKWRIAGTLLLVAGGVVLWLMMSRSPAPNVGPDLAASSPVEPAGRLLPPAPSAPPEGNPIVPEEAAELVTNSLPQSAVLPKPRPISIASVEEPPAGPEPAEGAPVDLPPATMLENMRTVIRQYTLRYGGNPVGSNAEITAALQGQNPGQATFLNPDDGARVNARGELVDNWNTPYFFHQLSRTEMEIRSAGSDRKMWTSDDLVVK